MALSQRQRQLLAGAEPRRRRRRSRRPQPTQRQRQLLAGAQPRRRRARPAPPPRTKQITAGARPKDRRRMERQRRRNRDVQRRQQVQEALKLGRRSRRHPLSRPVSYGGPDRDRTRVDLRRFFSRMAERSQRTSSSSVRAIKSALKDLVELRERHERDPLRAGVADVKTAARVAEITGDIAARTITDPKTRKATLRSVPELLAGAPAGLVAAVADPEKAYKGLKQGLKQSYKDKQTARKLAQEHGSLEYLANLLPAGAVAGRGLTMAAKLTPAKRAVTKPRPAIKRGGRIRGQAISPNLFVNFAQRVQDAARAAAQERNIRRANEGKAKLRPDRVGIPAGAGRQRKLVTPVDLPVPKPLRKSRRAARGREATEVGRNRIAVRTKLAQELGEAVKNFRSLSDQERRYFKLADEFGLSPDRPDVVRELMTKRRDEILAGRQRNQIEPKDPDFDELQRVEELIDDPSRITPRLREVADAERGRMQELASYLPDQQRELRRLGPLIRTLGLERGVIPRQRTFAERLEPTSPEIRQLDREITRLTGLRNVHARMTDDPFSYGRMRDLDAEIEALAIRRQRAAGHDYDPNARDLTPEQHAASREIQRRENDLLDLWERREDRQAEWNTLVRMSDDLRRAGDDESADEALDLAREIEDEIDGELAQELDIAVDALREARGRVGERAVQFRGDDIERDLAQLDQPAVPDLIKVNEELSAFLVRVREQLAEGGIEEPGYFRHEGPYVKFDAARKEEPHGPGVRRDKATAFRLHDLGMASSNIDAYLRGLAANVKRAGSIELMEGFLDRAALPGFTGLSKREVLDAIEDHGWDSSDIAVVSADRFRRARSRDEALDSDDLPSDLDTPELAQDWDNAAFDLDAFRRIDDDRGDTWAIVDRAHFDEFTKQITASRVRTFLSRATSKVLKSWPSQVILGTNPSWAVLQVLNNATLAALAGVGPFTMWKSYRFWKQNPELERQARPFAGATTFEPELLGVGSELTPFLKGSLRAFATSRLGTALREGGANPLKWLFMFDRAQTNHFRRAVLFKELNRKAFRDMGDGFRGAYENMRRANSIFLLPPVERVRALLDNADLMDDIAEHVNKTLGNYTTFGAAERAVLERNIMFYGFLRFSVRFTLSTLPRDHPFFTALATHLSQLHEDEVRRLLGADADDPLPPGALAEFHFTADSPLGGVLKKIGYIPEDTPGDTLFGLGLGRVNPAMNPITQASGFNQLAGALSPVVLETLNQLANKNIYFNEPFLVQGETTPRERGLSGIGLEDRARIFAGGLARMAFPYRLAEDLATGGRPQGADSLLGDRPTRYNDPELALRIELQGRRRDREPRLQRVLGQLLGIAPRRSYIRERFRNEQVKRRKRANLPETPAQRRESREEDRQLRREFGTEYFDVRRQIRARQRERQRDIRRRRQRDRIEQRRRDRERQPRATGAKRVRSYFAAAAKRGAAATHTRPARPPDGSGGSAGGSRPILTGYSDAPTTRVPQLNNQQNAVLSTILRVAEEEGATQKEIEAAVATGLVESNLTNPSSGDGSSVGWRQETKESYPNVNRMDVEASARRFFRETRAVRDQYDDPGALAQAVQRSAFPERYGQRMAEARAILAAAGRTRGRRAPRLAGGTPASGKTITYERTLPGREDVEAAILDVLSTPSRRRGSLFDELTRRLDSGAYTIPGRTEEVDTGVPAEDPEAEGALIRGAGGYPLGKRGKVIGGPHQGTHTLGNWQSDNAVDIAVPRGTPVLAVGDGVVVKVTRRKDGGGRFAGSSITIRTKGNQYFYTHLSRVSVKPGQRVRRGQIIGRSGVANGVPHLHFGQQRGRPRYG